MANSFVQVAPDSTGKEVQTYQNTVGGQVVQSQAVVLVDTTSTPITTLPVSLATAPSTPVTNTGTFAVQATLGTTQRTPASSVVSSNGSVTAGAQSVQFIPSTNFTGTLLGSAWPGTNAAVGFAANGNDTLAALAYTVTTGSITILTIT